MLLSVVIATLPHLLEFGSWVAFHLPVLADRFPEVADQRKIVGRHGEVSARTSGEQVVAVAEKWTRYEIDSEAATVARRISGTRWPIKVSNVDQSCIQDAQNWSDEPYVKHSHCLLSTGTYERNVKLMGVISHNLVYRVPATGSPITKDHVPAGAMIGWNVARHWAAGDGGSKMASKFKRLVIWRSVSLFFVTKSLSKG